MKKSCHNLIKTGLITLILLCPTLVRAGSLSPLQQPSLLSESLAAHNKWRNLHQAPPLVWNTTLAAFAAKHAKRCQFQHSPSHPYGENLAAGYPSISAAVKAWYAESREYNYNKPGFSKSTGHFTQLVWKDSRELGCGYSSCKGKNGTPGNFLVCEYSPAGNVSNEGYFKRNVLKAQ